MAKKVTVSIYADTSNYRRGMKDLGDDPGISKATGLFKTFAATVGIAGAALVGLTLKTGFDRALNIEDATAKLKGLGYAASDVKDVIATSLDAVVGTAFRLDDAVTGAAGAMAAGVKQGKDLRRYLGAVGDAAQIAGTDFLSMAAIFNKVTATGRVTAEELNQLGDRGIPILQLLAKEYGVSAEALRKMVSKGQVDAETFTRVMQENFAGAALAGGDTVRGAFANMGAALARFGAKIVTPLLPIIKDLLNTISQFADRLALRLDPILEKFFKPNGIFDRANEKLSIFTGWIVKNKETIAAVTAGLAAAGAAYTIATGAIEAINSVIAITNALMALSPIGVFALAFVAIAGVIAYIVTKNKQWNEVLDKAKGTWKTLTEIWDNIKKPATDASNAIEKGFRTVYETLSNDLLPYVDDLKEGFKNLFSAVVDLDPQRIGGALGQIVSSIVNAVTSLGGTLFGAAENIDWDKVSEGFLNGLHAVQSAVGEFFTSLAENIDWEQVRKTFEAAVDALFKTIAGIFNTAIDTAADITDQLTTLFSEIDWKKVTNAIIDGLDTVKDTIFEKISDFLTSIDWTKAITTVYNNITLAFETLGDILSNIDWDKVADFAYDAFGDLVTLIVDFVKNIDWTKVAEAFGKMTLALIKFFSFTLPLALIKGIIAFQKKLAEEIVERIKETDWSNVAQTIGKGLLAAIKFVFVDLPPKLWELFLNAITAAFQFIKDVDWSNVAKTVALGILKLIKFVAVDLPPKLWELFIGAIKGAWNFITNIDWGEVVQWISEANIKLFKLVFLELPQKLNSLFLSAIKGAWNFITNIDWGEVVQWISEANIKLIQLAFITFPQYLAGVLVSKFQQAFSALVSALPGIASGVWGFFQSIPGRIISFLSGAGQWLYGVGVQIIQGLINGVRAMFGQIGSTFTSIPKGIIDRVKNIFGINSPSRVFKDIGAGLLEGLVIGLNDLSDVNRSIARINTAVTGGITTDVAINSNGVPISQQQVTKKYEITLNGTLPTAEVGREIKNALTEFERISA